MSFSNYQQSVIINDNLLAGVQSVDGSYSINQKPINIAGVGFVDALIDSPMVGNFSISRLMTGPDPLLEKDVLGKYKFDEEDFSGVILYDEYKKGFGFNQGRVSSYSVNFNVGDIPEIQTNITVYGHMGANVSNSSGYIIKENSRYLPFSSDGYTSSEVYLGERFASNIVTDQWNNGELNITYDQYEKLPNVSKREKWSSTVSGKKYQWLLLGKDVFKLNAYSEESIDNLSQSPIQYPDQSSVKITINDFQVDPITSFSFSRSINTKPIYSLPQGSLKDWDDNTGPKYKNLSPIQIDTIYPIETDFNITMIAEEYEIREIKDRIQSAPVSNIFIDICDAFDNNIVINQLRGHNVRLVGETINSSINGELSISMTYKGYETKNR